MRGGLVRGSVSWTGVFCGLLGRGPESQCMVGRCGSRNQMQLETWFVGRSPNRGPYAGVERECILPRPHRLVRLFRRADEVVDVEVDLGDLKVRSVNRCGSACPGRSQYRGRKVRCFPLTCPNARFHCPVAGSQVSCARSVPHAEIRAEFKSAAEIRFEI